MYLMKKLIKLHWALILIKEFNQSILQKSMHTKQARMTCVKTKKLNSNPNFSQIPDHLCRILLIGGSRLGKTNALLNSLSHQLDIGKICLCANHPYEAKYWLFIKKIM